MGAAPRHKYVIVLGSCCTADAIRPKDYADIRGAKLRLLWYQGRTSLLSMGTAGLEPHEFSIKKEDDGKENQPQETAGPTGVEWGMTMAQDESLKRQQKRLRDLIGMCDAIIFDFVSAFGYPYLVVDPERYFVRSAEWQRHIALHADHTRKWLWEFPIERSLAILRQTLEPLYQEQPELHVVFHVPRPCYNDGVHFDIPEVAAQVSYYHQYGERLYEEAVRSFPGVSAVSCGGERADPEHYNGPFPFHYDESYLNALQAELQRLLA